MVGVANAIGANGAAALPVGMSRQVADGSELPRISVFSRNRTDPVATFRERAHSQSIIARALDVQGR
jgi:hypothetical protein